MSDWLNKAKEAAKQAAEQARTLADKAKNADYGAMLEKTKTMAREAGDEARKAADALTGKKTTGAAEAADTTSTSGTTAPGAPQTSYTTQPWQNPDYVACLRQLERVEGLLQEIKKILRGG